MVKTYVSCGLIGIIIWLIIQTYIFSPKPQYIWTLNYYNHFLDTWYTESSFMWGYDNCQNNKGCFYNSKEEAKQGAWAYWYTYFEEELNCLDTNSIIVYKIEPQ